MNVLLQQLLLPAAWGMDGVSARTQALAADLTTRVERAVARPAEAEVSPADASQEGFAIGSDELQLAKESGHLPPAARQVVTDLNDAVDRLMTRLDQHEAIAADDPDLLQIRQCRTDLDQLLNPAPVLDAQAIGVTADAVVQSMKDGAPHEALAALLKLSDRPAEMQALVGALAERGQDFSSIYQSLGGLDQGLLMSATAGSLSADQKAGFIADCAAHMTPPERDQAILSTLQAVKPAEMQAVMDGLAADKVDFRELYRKMATPESQAQFMALVAPSMSVDQKADAIADLARGAATPARQEGIRALMLSETEPVGQAALKDGLAARGVTDERVKKELDGGTGEIDYAYGDLRALQRAGIPMTVEGLQQAFLDRLPEGQRDEAQALLGALADSGRLDTTLLVQVVLFEDPIRTPLKPDKTTHVAPDRQQMVMDTLRDLADPCRISQGEWGTCAATRVQMSMAMGDPGRYAEVIRDLGMSRSATELVPGLRLPDDVALSGTEAAPSQDGSAVTGVGSRSLTTRMLSSALMNLADGGDYSSTTDKNVATNIGGLYPDQAKLVIEESLGIQVDIVTFRANDPPYTRESLYQQVNEAAGRGSVPVNLNWGDGGNHAVMFEGAAVDPTSGKEVALLINPWGERQTMPMEDFKARLTAAFVPQADGPPIARPDNWFSTFSYKPLADWQFKSPQEVLTQGASFQAVADPDLQARIQSFVADNKLTAGFVGLYLQPLLDQGRLDGPMLDSLQAVATAHPGKDELQPYLAQQVNSVERLASSPGFSQLSPELQQGAFDLVAQTPLGNDALDQLAVLAGHGGITERSLREFAAAGDGPAVTAAIDTAFQARATAGERYASRMTPEREPESFGQLDGAARERLGAALIAWNLPFSEESLAMMRGMIAAGELDSAAIAAMDDQALMEILKANLQ